MGFCFMKPGFYDKRQLIGCRGACSTLPYFSFREDMVQADGELLGEDFPSTVEPPAKESCPGSKNTLLGTVPAPADVIL